MPVDLRCILRDSQTRDAYEHSLINRGSNNKLAELETAFAVYAATRHAVKARDDFVHSIRQEGFVADDDAKQKLKELDEEIRKLDNDLKENLRVLPNMVDLLLETEIQAVGLVCTMTASRHKNVDVSLVESSDNILLALGGYEEFSGGCILTGIGIVLSEALNRHAISFLQQSLLDSNPLKTWNLPNILNLAQERYHCIWGNAVSRSEAVVQAPSWMAVLESLRSKKLFFDGCLPMGHLLKCQSIAGQMIVDERDRARADSWVLKRKSWYHRLIKPEHTIELLILTGPSLISDSRPTQLHVAQKVKLFYQQLAPESMVSVRALSAPELLPAEASRVVIEGYLPSSGRTVVLGYLSNLLDFASAELRHGVTREGLHVLHGQFCSTSETLAWLLEYAVQPRCVYLPDCLLMEARLKNPLPFMKEVRTTKSGKRIVVAIENSTRSNMDASLSITPEMIRHEALTSPFDFLPFFHRYDPNQL